MLSSPDFSLNVVDSSVAFFFRSTTELLVIASQVLILVYQVNADISTTEKFQPPNLFSLSTLTFLLTSQMSLLNLPGLNLGTVGPSGSSKKQDVILEPGSEWRFEIPFKSKYTIKLIRGTAEIFGTEIALGQEYTFSGYKGAVYTWQGCLLEYGPTDDDTTSGGEINEYTSEETPMNFFVNLHFGLEKMRGPIPSPSAPPQSLQTAPRILVIGPKDCGKTSLCKLLVAYANKCGRFPMFCNTDPAESVYSVPGALSATVVSDILDVEQGWGSSAITGPVMLHTKQPIAFLYGLEKIQTNIKYYSHMVSRLAIAVNTRLQTDVLAQTSGLVVDTPSDLVAGADPQQGYSAIANMISDFEINVVLVVGQERLYSEMLKRFGKPTSNGRRPPPTVIKVPKSGGCVDREPAYRRAVQAALINEYFYGSPKQPLSPYTVTVDYSTLCIYRVAEGMSLSVPICTSL